MKRYGETVWLQRSSGGSLFVRAEVLAFVQALTREQLIGSISQQNLFIIISPTHLFDIAQWPGGMVPGVQTFGVIDPSDQRFPRTSDVMFVRGSQKAITNCKPVFVKRECVRIELTCLG